MSVLFMSYTYTNTRARVYKYICKEMLWKNCHWFYFDLLSFMRYET